MLIKKICKICGEECFLLKKHLKEKHNLTEEDYYDNYLKKPGEGICPICGKPTPRKSIIMRGYKSTCCEQCHKIFSVQNWRESQKRNHNGGYYSGTQEYRDRRKKDCQEQFGCDYYWQAKEIKEKRKQSMLEHHGVEHTMQKQEFKEIAKEHREKTNLEKYGYKHNWSSPELRERGQYKTCLEKFGVKFPAQNKEVLEKMKETTKKLYNREHYTQTDEFKNKIREFWKNLTEEELVSIVKSRKHKYKAPNGKTYDSSWEYKFELYLVEHKINYEYQSSTTFKWIDYNGKERTYIPDFKLITENDEELVEIKGDYFFDKDGNFFDPYNKTEEGYYNAQRKYECMIKNGVKILLSSDLVKLGIKM